MDDGKVSSTRTLESSEDTDTKKQPLFSSPLPRGSDEDVAATTDSSNSAADYELVAASEDVELDELEAEIARELED